MGVDCAPLIRGIVRDEALTRGLGDIEARMLVEWVVHWAELLAEAAQSFEDARSLVMRISTTRAISIPRAAKARPG